MKKSTLRTALDIITEGGNAAVAESLLAEAVSVQNSGKPWTMNKGVQGFGIGRRVSEGEQLSDWALKVYVEKKKPVSKLGKEMVPATIPIAGLSAEIETDVEEIGKLDLELDTARHRPAFPGCGLGHVDITVGTFGCLVRKKGSTAKVFILSNSHVLAKEGLAAIGDDIIQPGDSDGGSPPDDVIGELAGFVPFDFGPSFNNLVDAAIAKVKRKNQVTSRIGTLGVVPSGVGIARVGSRVKKVGRTTGFTLGEVRDTDFKTQLTYAKPNGGTGVVRFQDQVLCTRYTAGGDSGSLVLHESSNKALGLHFAGSPSSSVFNKIHHVLDLLDIEIITDEV